MVCKKYYKRPKMKNYGMRGDMDYTEREQVRKSKKIMKKIIDKKSPTY